MPRLPRFKRATTVRNITISERDHEIIRLTHRYRFLRSTHILALVHGSRQQLLRRLQLLFHHGYLARPRMQIDYYGTGGSQPIVYGLGNKGAKLLQEKLGIKLPHLRWNEKNQDIRKPFLAHALAVTDAMAALELGIRARHDINLTWHDHFQDRKNKPGPWKWRVRLNAKVTLGIVPDRVFSIDVKMPDGRTSRSFFFLEADRGTMPVVRKHLIQTSMHRKFLAYHATWRDEVHKTQFGIDRFRVLIVTTSAARMAKLIDSCQNLPRGLGLFLFSECAAVTGHSDLLFSSLKNGRSKPAKLFP